MRATWSIVLAATMCWSGSLLAADAQHDSPQVVAERIFGNADKNKDGTLDDKEVLEAKRIFKAAILRGKKSDELPGGKHTFDRIEDAAMKGKLDDNKNGQVSSKEWTEFVKDAFKKKESILKDAHDKHAAAKKSADEKAKTDRLRHEQQVLQQKLQQQKLQQQKKKR